MKKTPFLICCIAALSYQAIAQESKGLKAPSAVKTELQKRYPAAKKVTWEKEKGNFEANWGGKSGEDTSVMFTPSGHFIEQVVAIPVSSLPESVKTFVSTHYKGAKIKEAGSVTDAQGKKMFEAEIKGKDLIFDESGKFLKVD